jgi:hypothetical protein
MRPQSAPPHFLRDMRAVLMAELDLRMQAVRGLVDAYNSEIKLSR